MRKAWPLGQSVTRNLQMYFIIVLEQRYTLKPMLTQNKRQKEIYLGNTLLDIHVTDVSLENCLS